MYDSETIKEFCSRLLASLPETPMPTSDYDKGYNEAMRLVSVNSDSIRDEMLKETE